MTDTDPFVLYRDGVSGRPQRVVQAPTLNARGRRIVRLISSAVWWTAALSVGIAAGAIVALALGLDRAMTETIMLPCPTATSLASDGGPCIYDGPSRSGSDLSYVIVPTLDDRTAIVSLDVWGSSR